MAHVGGSFQILAIIAGAISAIFYIISLRQNRRICISCGSMAHFVMFGGVALAVVLLTCAILYNDFNIRYISLYSDRQLPLIYKISVLWCGQAGGFLIFCFFISFLTMAEIFRLRSSEEQYSSFVNIVSAFICSCFAAIAFFIFRPFAELDFLPLDGSGLSPSLQNIYIYLYPFCRYMWLSCAVILFSHSLASLLRRDLSDYWITRCRIWIYLSLFFVSGAFIIKGLWSYRIFAFFWDWSADNIILVMAFLSISALIHSSFSYRLNRNLKLSSFCYVFIFFLAALFSLYFFPASSEYALIRFKYSYYEAAIIFIIALYSLIFLWSLFYNREQFFFRKKSRAFNNFKVVNILFSSLMFFIFAGILFQFTAGAAQSASKYYIFISIPFAAFSIFFIFKYHFLPVILHILGKRIINNIRIKTGSVFIHIGVIIIIASISISSYARWDEAVTVYSGGSTEIERVRVEAGEIKTGKRDNYAYTSVDISLISDEKMVGNISSEIRGYNNSNKLSTETESRLFNAGVISVAFLSCNFISGEVKVLISCYPYILLIIPGFLLAAVGFIIRMKFQ